MSDTIPELKKKITYLTERILALEKQLTSEAETKQLIEHRGAYFKRKVGGEYDEVIFCFTCLTPMSNTGIKDTFMCSHKHIRTFDGKSLDDLMRELRKKK